MKQVTSYETALKNMCKEFVRKWWKELYDEDCENYTISDYHLIWGWEMSMWPLCIQDEYYFSVDEVYEVLKNKIPMEVVREFWWYCMENEKKEINLINFWKLKTLWKEKFNEMKEKDIRKSERKAKKVEKEFRDMLNDLSKKQAKL